MFYIDPTDFHIGLFVFCCYYEWIFHFILLFLLIWDYNFILLFILIILLHLYTVLTNFQMILIMSF